MTRIFWWIFKTLFWSYLLLNQRSKCHWFSFLFNFNRFRRNYNWNIILWWLFLRSICIIHWAEHTLRAMYFFKWNNFIWIFYTVLNFIILLIISFIAFIFIFTILWFSIIRLRALRIGKILFNETFIFNLESLSN